MPLIPLPVFNKKDEKKDSAEEILQRLTGQKVEAPPVETTVKAPVKTQQVQEEKRAEREKYSAKNIDYAQEYQTLTARGDMYKRQALETDKAIAKTGRNDWMAQSILLADKTKYEQQAQEYYDKAAEARAQGRAANKQESIADYEKYRSDPHFAEGVRLGGHMVTTEKEKADTANKWQNASLQMFTENKADQLSAMSSKELSMYSYLLATQGKDAADEFFGLVEESLNQRIGTKEAEALQESKIGGLAAPIAGFQSAVTGGVQAVGALAGKELPTSSLQYTSQKVRGDLNAVPGALYDIAYTAGNMAPSIAASTMLGGAGVPAKLASAIGSLTLGTSSAGNAYKEGLERGYTQEEAVTYGILNGASEAGMQYLLGGISKLGSGVVSGKLAGGLESALAKVIKNPKVVAAVAELAASMGSEFTEEYLQEVLDPVWRNIAANEHNKVEPFTQEALYAGILGALTAGIFEGPGVARGTVTGAGQSIDTQAEIVAPTAENPAQASAQGVNDNTATIKLALEKRVGGDDLLNAMDLVETIRDVGGVVDDSGYVEVYHRTSPQAAEQIKETGKMVAQEDGLFFSTKENGQNAGYGDAVIKMYIPAEKLILDDQFTDEVHLRLALGSVRAANMVAYINYAPKQNSAENPAQASAQGGNQANKEPATSQDTAPVQGSLDSNAPNKDINLQKLEQNPDVVVVGDMASDTPNGIIGLPRKATAKEIAADTMTRKSQEYKARQEKKFIETVSEAFGVPKTSRSVFSQTVAEIGDAIVRTEKVDDATLDALFEVIYDEARIFDTTGRDMNKEMIEFMKDTWIKPDGLSSDDRRALKGKLRVNSKATDTITGLYEDLQSTFGNVLPEGQDPADITKAILDVFKQSEVKEYKLDVMGADYKPILRKLFDDAVYNMKREMGLVTRYEAQRKAKADRMRTEAEAAKNEHAVEEAYNNRKKLRRDVDRAAAKTMLTPADRKMVDAAIAGGMDKSQLKPHLIAYYYAKKAFAENDAIVAKHRALHIQRLEADANFAIESSDNWKDKKAGILYKRETQERNVRDIIGNDIDAQYINEHYFAPVHENEAEKTKFINKKLADVRALGLTKQERQAVQLQGELADVNMRMKSLAQRGRTDSDIYKRYEEQRNTITDMLASLDASEITQSKVDAGVVKFRALYNTLFSMANEAYIDNGYEPIEYRQNYFPHFITDEPDTKLGKALREMGLHLANVELPTSIAGLTDTFKPGRSWFGHEKSRKGMETTYDAVEGFELYLRSISDVIYHTDDIQRIRALENAIRYKYSAEGIKQRAKEITERAKESTEDIDLWEINEQLKNLYDGSQLTRLSGFVQNLREYGNKLANKASKGDRGAEENWGRKVYELGRWYQNRMAANMVAVNPASWLTNFAALTQAWAEVKTEHIVKGMYDTLVGYARGSGFADDSTFLTNRFGTDTLLNTPLERLTDTLAKPFEWIDGFAAESIVRSRYEQNIAEGMDATTAMDDADAFAASVMGDRSKGAMPLLHEEKNPLTKMFTMFQLEVNNTLSYAFKDVPRDLKDKGLFAITKAFFKMFLGAWLFNELYEKLVGRRVILDPADIIANAVENVVAVARGEKKIPEAVLDVTGNIGNYVPYVGTFMGGEGGRLPVANALPDGTKLLTAFEQFRDDEKQNAAAWNTLYNSMKGPLAYILPPVGGGQIKKTAEGIDALIKGGSYKNYGTDEERLQYELTPTPENIAKAVLFGKWAPDSAREYVDNAFPLLSVDDTRAYRMAKEAGVDGTQFLDLRVKIKGYRGEDESTKKSRDLIMKQDLTPEQKALIDRELLRQDSGFVADYSSETMFKLSQMGKDVYEKAQENIKGGLTPEEALMVEEYRAEYREYKPTADKSSTVQFREALYENDSLTPAQKKMLDEKIIGNQYTPDYSSEDAFTTDSSEYDVKHKWKVQGYSQDEIDTYYEWYQKKNAYEPQKNLAGETVKTSTDLTRAALMADTSLTAQEKAKIDSAVIGNKFTYDYSSRAAYELCEMSGSTGSVYNKAKEINQQDSRITLDQTLLIAKWWAANGTGSDRKERFKSYLFSLGFGKNRVWTVLQVYDYDKY